MLNFQSYYQRSSKNAEGPSPLEAGDESIFRSMAMVNGKVDQKKLPKVRTILGDTKVDYILAQLEGEKPKAETPPPKLPPLPPPPKASLQKKAKSAVNKPLPVVSVKPLVPPPPPVSPQLRKLTSEEKLATFGLDKAAVLRLSGKKEVEAGAAQGSSTHAATASDNLTSLSVLPLQAIKGSTNPDEVGSRPPLPKSPAATVSLPKLSESVLPKVNFKIVNAAFPKWLNKLLSNLPPPMALMTADANHARSVELIRSVIDEVIADEAAQPRIVAEDRAIQQVALDLNALAVTLSEKSLNCQKLLLDLRKIETDLRSSIRAEKIVTRFIDLVATGEISWKKH